MVAKVPGGEGEHFSAANVNLTWKVRAEDVSGAFSFLSRHFSLVKASRLIIAVTLRPSIFCKASPCSSAAMVDLQAIAAFYDTPAGKRLAAAQPQRAQIQLNGMQQWMQGVAPEMQSKIVKAVQAYGRAVSGQSKPH